MNGIVTGYCNNNVLVWHSLIYLEIWTGVFFLVQECVNRSICFLAIFLSYQSASTLIVSISGFCAFYTRQLLGSLHIMLSGTAHCEIVQDRLTASGCQECFAKI